MGKRIGIVHGDMAIQWASAVIYAAYKRPDFSLLDQLDYYGIDYIHKSFKPHKKTILHDYIEAVIMDEYSYLLDKHLLKEAIDELDECAKYYQLSVAQLGERTFQFDSDGDLICGNFYDAEKYAYNFLNLFQQKLLSTLAEDTFTILYSDKNLLAFFCKEIAKIICGLKVSDYPDVLAADGIIRRCPGWPSWLKDGIRYRDKERCQLCGCDTTAILKPDIKPNIDHIIPLNMGGINDPINLQLTCEHCNKSKGSRNMMFNNIATPFWRLDDYEQE